MKTDPPGRDALRRVRLLKRRPPPGQDSPAAYILCHLWCVLGNVTITLGLIWLSWNLRSPWVLLGLLLLQNYKHDFNKRRRR